MNSLYVLQKTNDLRDRCAKACSSSFAMAEIFARTSEPMLPSTRS